MLLFISLEIFLGYSSNWFLLLLCSWKMMCYYKKHLMSLISQPNNINNEINNIKFLGHFFLYLIGNEMALKSSKQNSNNLSPLHSSPKSVEKRPHNFVTCRQQIPEKNIFNFAFGKMKISLLTCNQPKSLFTTKVSAFVQRECFSHWIDFQIFIFILPFSPFLWLHPSATNVRRHKKKVLSVNNFSLLNIQSGFGMKIKNSLTWLSLYTRNISRVVFLFHL